MNYYTYHQMDTYLDTSMFGMSLNKLRVEMFKQKYYFQSVFIFILLLIFIFYNVLCLVLLLWLRGFTIVIIVSTKNKS